MEISLFQETIKQKVQATLNTENLFKNNQPTFYAKKRRF